MGIKQNMIEQRRGGFYWLDGQPFLSVTEILKIIDKPALMYWFGREVYYAMLKDPTLDERTALAAPYAASDSAKERGKTVHSLVEGYKSAGTRAEHIPEQYRGYANAFYDFMGDFQIEIIDNEKSVISTQHKIAGTMDMYAKVNGKHMIIDVKTGKDIYMEAGLQLSAYAAMQREAGNKVDEIAVLLLETGKDGLPTGKYKFQNMKDDFTAFLAVKSVYCYVNQEKINKVGYKG